MVKEKLLCRLEHDTISANASISKGRNMEPFLPVSRPLVVLNPAANRGHMQRYRVSVRQRAADEGAQYIETTRAGQAEELARQAANDGRALIIVGGDGSVHEAVNGLLAAEKRVPLGIIAAG